MLTMFPAAEKRNRASAHNHLTLNDENRGCFGISQEQPAIEWVGSVVGQSSLFSQECLAQEVALVRG
jgi:hypothetical protein